MYEPSNDLALCLKSSEESLNNSRKQTTKLLSVSRSVHHVIPNFSVGKYDFNLQQSPNDSTTIVPMGPGLYLIYCLANNKYYIGQSNNASYRLGRHFENLKVNRSDSKKLQEDWTTYGEKNFKFILLASGPFYSDETIRLQIEKELIALNNHSIYNVIIPFHHGRKARILWNCDVYDSIAAASRASKVSKTEIARLTKDPSVTEWQRVPDDPSDESLVLNSETGKRISIDGIPYRSIKNAELRLGFSRRTIKRRLQNHSKFPTYLYLD